MQLEPQPTCEGFTKVSWVFIQITESATIQHKQKPLQRFGVREAKARFQSEA